MVCSNRIKSEITSCFHNWGLDLVLGTWYLVHGPVHKSSGPPMGFVVEISGTKLCKVQTRDKAQRLAEIARQIRWSPMEVGAGTEDFAGWKGKD